MNEENSGSVFFEVSSAQGAFPIPEANILVSSDETGDFWYLSTDESGKSEQLILPAPEESLSLTPQNKTCPYTRYTAQISASGYITVTIDGVDLFPDVVSIVPVCMQPDPKGSADFDVNYEVGENTLESDTPRPSPPAPAAREEEERILTRVIIPERIRVHLGAPSNRNASTVSVRFPDYIKNVASSEIYPTWPENAIRANVLAQISFALNRIFTEWYPSQGYAFDITNNTAFDQYFVPGRSIPENISRLVDELFHDYVVRGNSISPYFTEYCSGSTVTCPGMSQWGTVELAQRGYTPLQILQYYYGNEIRIVSTNNIEAVSSSYPGSPLQNGSSSSSVRTIQRQLNRIRENFPAIPWINPVDGVFGAQTAAAVRAFQSVFNLAADGIVGRTTWNKISYLYTVVTRMAELNGEGEMMTGGSTSATIASGSRGSIVRVAQNMLRKLSGYYPSIPRISADGIFGAATERAVRAFQRFFGLTPDGIVGPVTWQYLTDAFLGAADTEGFRVNYPGTALRNGSRGNSVWLMQSYLAEIAPRLGIPAPGADGIFGTGTERAVREFQRAEGLGADGVIGRNTWDRIVAVRLAIRT